MMLDKIMLEKCCFFFQMYSYKHSFLNIFSSMLPMFLIISLIMISVLLYSTNNDKCFTIQPSSIIPKFLIYFN